MQAQEVVLAGSLLYLKTMLIFNLKQVINVVPKVVPIFAIWMYCYILMPFVLFKN